MINCGMSSVSLPGVDQPTSIYPPIFSLYPAYDTDVCVLMKLMIECMNARMFQVIVKGIHRGRRSYFHMMAPKGPIHTIPSKRWFPFIYIFYRHFHGHCSQEIRDIIPVPLSVSGPPEAQRIHTISKFHFLLHELYPTNHHSSQEHAVLWNVLPPCFPEYYNCHLSNLRSINVIRSLSPLIPSLSSFFLCRGIA